MHVESHSINHLLRILCPTRKLTRLGFCTLFVMHFWWNIGVVLEDNHLWKGDVYWTEIVFNDPYHVVAETFHFHIHIIRHSFRTSAGDLHLGLWTMPIFIWTIHSLPDGQQFGAYVALALLKSSLVTSASDAIFELTNLRGQSHYAKNKIVICFKIVMLHCVLLSLLTTCW